MYYFADMPQIGDELRVQFPHPREADKDGVIGTGGNLSPGLLLSAYEQGIFPWYADSEPILWWSPDPRFVLFTDEFHISRRNRRSLRQRNWQATLDRDFAAVIAGCANAPRSRENGTWIGPAMMSAYCELHRLGHAHSVEVWEEETVIGGLYGLSRGAIFFGESMFSLQSGASTLAMAALINFLRHQNITLIDSQVGNPHIERLGGRNISRLSYLQRLATALQGPAIEGWRSFSLASSAL